MTFQQMMEGYAEVSGVSGVIVPVPVLAPRLAGLWVGLVTPIPHDIALPLVEGVVQPVIGDPTRALERFPDIRPISYRRAVELALERIETGAVPTRWSGALGDGATFEYEDREGIVREVRTRKVERPPRPSSAPSPPWGECGGGWSGTWPGGPGGSWISWSAAPGFEGGGGIPPSCSPGSRGLLAGGGHGARSSPPAACRDAGSGAGMAPVGGDPRGGTGPASCRPPLRARRTHRGPLLVRLFFAHAFIFSDMVDAVGKLAERIHRGEDALVRPPAEAGAPEAGAPEAGVPGAGPG
jgi:hypothetical protein